jgi:hypothetical protein
MRDGGIGGSEHFHALAANRRAVSDTERRVSREAQDIDRLMLWAIV